jgi:hypothetical protein
LEVLDRDLDFALACGTGILSIGDLGLALALEMSTTTGTSALTGGGGLTLGIAFGMGAGVVSGGLISSAMTPANLFFTFSMTLISSFVIVPSFFVPPCFLNKSIKLFTPSLTAFTVDTATSGMSGAVDGAGGDAFGFLDCLPYGSVLGLVLTLGATGCVDCGGGWSGMGLAAGVVLLVVLPFL